MAEPRMIEGRARRRWPSRDDRRRSAAGLPSREPRRIGGCARIGDACWTRRSPSSSKRFASLPALASIAADEGAAQRMAEPRAKGDRRLRPRPADGGEQRTEAGGVRSCTRAADALRVWFVPFRYMNDYRKTLPHSRFLCLAVSPKTTRFAFRISSWSISSA